VHSGASRARNVNALFFMLRWAGMDSTKCKKGHVTPNMWFFIRWDLLVTQCILVRSWRETSTNYFSCSGRTGAYSTKSGP
jgi:hypothetical protein